MKLKCAGSQSANLGKRLPSNKGKPLLTKNRTKPLLTDCKPIKAGAIIDIIAPSSPLRNSQWKKGVTILKRWGLKPHLIEGTFSPWLFHANNNKNRSVFLNRAFFNQNSSAVWMMRGGYGLQKIMLDFIKGYSQKGAMAKKKLFIGYSDGTALHLYLNGQNQPTLHAPLISELPSLSQKDLEHLKNILFGVKKEIVFDNLRVFQSSKPVSLRASSVHGRDRSLLKTSLQKSVKSSIIGGNLSLLSTSVGAPWCPVFAGHFLFVEDINEADYRVDRLLHHLFYSGALKSVKAILFGCFPHLTLPALRKVLKSFSDVCDIPLVFGLPCGHITSHQPLPFNTPAELVINRTRACLKVKF